MSGKQQFVFGPVPSRRIGRSLGVDIVPFKTCTFNCVYCQLGSCKETTVERKAYVPMDEVLAQLKEKLSRVTADYITISGSGEPTLNSQIGFLIEQIKKLTSIPVAVITNGSLLFLKDVRQELMQADLVIPSLDAATEDVLEKINRPEPSLNYNTIVEGLVEFRKEFSGLMWLEVFFIENYNTSEEHIRRLNQAIEKIRPDKIQVNTAVRPSAETAVERLSPEKLKLLASQIGENVEIIADNAVKEHTEPGQTDRESVFEMIKRHPSTIDDISKSFNITRVQAGELVDDLESAGLISKEQKNSSIFYKTTRS